MNKKQEDDRKTKGRRKLIFGSSEVDEKTNSTEDSEKWVA